jgi:hypothetical protein
LPPLNVSCVLVRELLAGAHQGPHLLGLSGRYEARPDQAVSEKFGEPHGIVDVGLAARHVLHMRGIRQYQLELAVIQDMPDRFPVDAGRLHRHMRAFVGSQPLGQSQKLRCRCPEGANFGADLAVSHQSQAGNHRLLVNVETATTRMPHFHRSLLWTRRRGAPFIKNSG